MDIMIMGYKGQGARTLSRILSRAGMLAGMFSQDFFQQGNVVKAYARMDKQPLLEKGPVNNPDIVLILDQSLFSAKEAKDNVTFILNATEKPKTVAKQKNVHVLDASEIALKNTGKGIPNMPIAGALAKYFAKIQLKHLKQAIELELDKNQKESAMTAEEGFKAVR